MWSAFMCSLSRSDPLGLFTRELEPDQADVGRQEELQVVPLIARADGDDVDPNSPLHLRILSLALTTRPLARRIRRLGLRRTVETMVDRADRTAVDEALSRHLLPDSTWLLGHDWSSAALLSERLERLRGFLAVQVGQEVVLSYEESIAVEAEAGEARLQQHGP
jgi:hypothetical protein